MSILSKKCKITIIDLTDNLLKFMFDENKKQRIECWGMNA